MMSSQLKNQAIQKALAGQWQIAIELNEQILKEEPNDIETLNRLGFAQAIAGKAKSAKLTFQRVLTLDSQNPIATKNLRKLKNNDTKDGFNAPSISLARENMFLEESGKTKVIDLVNIADTKVTSHLNTGETMELRVKRLKIFVLDIKNTYVGMLPDDIGKRLIKFIDGGNEYETYVKTVNKNKVTIFVREAKRSAKFKNLPSFSLGEKTKVSFVQKHHLKDTEDEEKEEDE